uniref:Uncharacterized protein n=1 Tax=Onchocerca volvulus TaxID=6282 RepID=A0A8R1XRG6_ONCVO
MTEKLKEIATKCEKDIELRLTVNDVVTKMDTLKRARDEYYQYVQTQNDIFDKQIKLLNDIQTMQVTDLTNKIRRLSNIFRNIDAKLSLEMRHL